MSSSMENNGSPETSSSTSSKTNGSNSTSNVPNFKCTICLDAAKDAVVSMCGHIFCGPCLHQWLEAKPLGAKCPLCNGLISHDKVIAIYGRGSNMKDVQNKALPPPLPPLPPSNGLKIIVEPKRVKPKKVELQKIEFKRVWPETSDGLHNCIMTFAKPQKKAAEKAAEACLTCVAIIMLVVIYALYKLR